MAAAVAAFRVGLEMWIDANAQLDLATVILDNLDKLTAGIDQHPDT